MPGGYGILLQTNEAAATLTVGVDAARNNRKRVLSRPRSIEGIALIGSAAINDTIVDFYAADHYFGQFLNSRAGVAAPILPDDLQPIAPTMVAPGDQLTLIIVDAPATNPLIIVIYGRVL